MTEAPGGPPIILLVGVVTVVGLSALVSCSGARTMPASPGKDNAAIQRVLDRIIAADHAGDPEAVVRTYADDAILLPPGAKPIAGREAIREHYARIFETHVLEVVLSSEETVVSGDWAFNRGRTSVRATAGAGSDARETSDKYLMILRREPNGQWQIVRLMWNRSGADEPGGE